MSREPNLTVSAILAVRNGADYLADSLEGIFDQTYPVHEVLVVDGHSTDDSVAIAERMGARVVVQPDRGQASARNLGIELAVGDLLAFQSHDDRWTPDKLELQVPAFEGDPDLMISHTHFTYEVEDGFVAPPQLQLRLDGPQAGRIPETMVARREVFDLIGGFDTSMIVAHDVDWLARALDRSVPMTMVPRSLLLKRLTGVNTSLDIPTNNREMLALLRRSVARKRGDDGTDGNDG